MVVLVHITRFRVCIQAPVHAMLCLKYPKLLNNFLARGSQQVLNLLFHLSEPIILLPLSWTIWGQCEMSFSIIFLLFDSNYFKVLKKKLSCKHRLVAFLLLQYISDHEVPCNKCLDMYDTKEVQAYKARTQNLQLKVSKPCS